MPIICNKASPFITQTLSSWTRSYSIKISFSFRERGEFSALRVLGVMKVGLLFRIVMYELMSICYMINKGWPRFVKANTCQPVLPMSFFWKL